MPFNLCSCSCSSAPPTPAPRSASPPGGFWRHLTAVALLTTAFSTAALAQQGGTIGGTISGTVTDSANGQPIPAVQITVQGTTVGAVTDNAGRYHLAGLTGTSATLSARRVGYAQQTRTATVGDSAANFVLAARAVNLDEVVVTGQQGGNRTRELGNAVTTVDAAEATKVMPIENFQQLLNGRAPNVVITQGSGAVGTGAKIRVRGTSSLSLSQDPLIYIDGVRANNAQATGPENQAFGSSTISRWNDIDPEDIERIDILKGPAAATLYGTEAQNGVINVVTKHGSGGTNDIDLTIRQGTNYFMDPSGRFPTNYQMVDGVVKSLNYDQLRQSFGSDFLSDGRYQKYVGSVGGTSGRFGYYISGVRELSQGAEFNNDLDRSSVRGNFTVNANDKFTVSSNLAYTTGHTNLSAEAGYGGTIWTTVLMDPANLSDPVRKGFYSGTPPAYNDEYHFSQDVSRFTGGLTIQYQPWTWFSNRLIVGADYTTTQDVEMAVRIDSLQNLFGSDALGYRIQGNTNLAYQTWDYAATGTAHAGQDWRFATSVGAQFFRRDQSTAGASGSVFAAPGQESINALTNHDAPTGDDSIRSSLGYYAQEEIGWLDRRFLTVGVRTDKNSTFGKDFGQAFYPKVGVSWVISEEPFFNNTRVVNSLRFRAAYGETGQAPDYGQAERTYISVTGPADGPAITTNTLGNPDLGPERGKETEIGFDASFFKERLGLEFTYYNKRTNNAILSRDVAPSVGSAGTQFINAGQISNTGVEIVLHAIPVRAGQFQWDFVGSFATNSNKIDNLGLGDVTSITAGRFLEHRTGFPVSSWFVKRVVHAELDDEGNAINVLCDDGKGGSMGCDDAPTVFFGNSVPKQEGSISNTFTLMRGLRLYSLIDFQLGMTKLDGNERVRCALDLGGRCREVFYPKEYDPIEIAQIQSGGDLPGFLITDAGFWKLREVSLLYDLPATWASKIRARGVTVSVAARNLHTWTNYKGLEPEATFLSGSRGGQNSTWEQTILPLLTSFIASVNVTF